MNYYIGEGGPAISEDRGEGLTVRDYFAAKAMQALCQDAEAWDTWSVVRKAYQIADVMMNVREEDIP